MKVRLIITFLVVLLILGIIYPQLDLWINMSIDSDYQTMIAVLIKSSIITLLGYILLISKK